MFAVACSKNGVNHSGEIRMYMCNLPITPFGAHAALYTYKYKHSLQDSLKRPGNEANYILCTCLHVHVLLYATCLDFKHRAKILESGVKYNILLLRSADLPGM